MGCDCNIDIPNDVRVRDVAMVIGILAGLPKSWKVDDKSTAKWVKVEGAKTKGCDIIPEMCTINLEGKMIDGETNHFCYYHFENDIPDYRHVSFRSTPFWIAVGLGVCKFFGGKIDYNDCDSVNCNKTFDKPRISNCPNNGTAWNAFQEEMFAIKALTINDLAKVQKKASYATEDVFKNSIVTVKGVKRNKKEVKEPELIEGTEDTMRLMG